ncbi:MAG: hypothetical protein A3G75_16255 [Verrucomicrobia bacterium RIFCSPLOWO2_12_FULL_64_8]|nr:MAG: hypothetical protein A3G75_16255 [Verrucomicrobia bacterium RIFCSPLOWO2_12_FULL_64_8]
MNQPLPLCLLFDNGSLRPEATLRLRTIARELEAALGVEVRAVSLLHSSAIDPAQLGGRAARLLGPALKAALQSGGREFVLLPLFFGPSAALADYVPERLSHLRAQFPAMKVRLARCLVDPAASADTRIAAILADLVRAEIGRVGLTRPKVALVDHGSPRRAVNVVREWLGGQMRGLLGGEIDRLETASMERRPEPEYDFNEPLLATLLQRPDFAQGDVVVARQFFAPGRHAGMGGDIEAICAEAQKRRAGLRIHLTGPVGGDARLIDVLADRYREARSQNGQAPTSGGCR